MYRGQMYCRPFYTDVLYYSHFYTKDRCTSVLFTQRPDVLQAFDTEDRCTAGLLYRGQMYYSPFIKRIDEQ